LDANHWGTAVVGCLTVFVQAANRSSSQRTSRDLVTYTGITPIFPPWSIYLDDDIRSFTKEIGYVDPALGQPDFHCRRLFRFSRAHPVMVEPINLDDLHHHLRLVEVIAIPEASIPAGCGNWTFSSLDVAPALVEVGIYTPEHGEAHQSGSSLYRHRRTICS